MQAVLEPASGTIFFNAMELQDPALFPGFIRPHHAADVLMRPVVEFIYD
jgi:hypothetical protein